METRVSIKTNVNQQLARKGYINMMTIKTNINGGELTITGQFNPDQAAGLVLESHRILTGIEPDAPLFELHGTAVPAKG